MAKIILGRTPKSFPKELKIPMLDGTVGHIKVDYKYRTRTDFAAYMDERLAAIKAESEAQMKAISDAAKAEAEHAKQAVADGADAPLPKIDFGLSQVELDKKKADGQIGMILDIVQGWNLDIPFDREAVAQLVAELPLAATTIIETYREAVTEGRLGN